jgi:hypothetical protein
LELVKRKQGRSKDQERENPEKEKGELEEKEHRVVEG